MPALPLTRAELLLALAALAACTAPTGTTSPRTSPTTVPAPATASPSVVATTPAVTTPAASPTQLTLGGRAPRSAAQGFGLVRPSAIDFGSHPTTVLRDVTWQSWGGAEARGSAQAVWIGPGRSTAEGVFESAQVRAYGVGSCGGQPAYTRLQWTFPGHESPSEQPTAFDLCTGEAVG